MSVQWTQKLSTTVDKLGQLIKKQEMRTLKLQKYFKDLQKQVSSKSLEPVVRVE